MAKKGKGRVNQKQVNTQSRKNILVNTSSQPTEPSKDEEKVIEKYAKASRPHVPVESPASEVITNFLVKWSHWIAWVSLFVAAIFAYSAFSNDITNAKDEINVLQETTKENAKKIVGIEKQQIIVSSDVRHIESQTSNLSKDASEIKSILRKVELEQVRLTSINHVDKSR